MSKKNGNKGLKAAIVILSILIIALSAFAVYLYTNNQQILRRSGEFENNLASANGDISRYENELSQKQQEAESYSRIIDEQSSVYESEKNELNEKISELNKQIALKRQRRRQPPTVFLRHPRLRLHRAVRLFILPLMTVRRPTLREFWTYLTGTEFGRPFLSLIPNTTAI